MLPVATDLLPMEALIKVELPRGGWQYEPKWDGFRCLAFRDGSSLELRSKNSKTLDRYFPEVQESLRELAAKKFVLDGEIVVPHGDGFSFDLLLQRIHPAASRIEKLSVETPAVFIVFDLLVDENGHSLIEQPLSVRRTALEEFAGKYIKRSEKILLSPASERYEDTEKWTKSFKHKLDGIMAKRLDLPYQSGNRKGMVKVKWIRTADCVIGGFRYGTGEKTIGSLLLGLYDKKGLLNHVGFCSSFDAKTKKELTALLEPLIEQPGFTGTKPNGASRWNKGEEKPWFPLRAGLVAEFKYDHFSDGRFRHGTTRCIGALTKSQVNARSIRSVSQLTA